MKKTLANPNIMNRPHAVIFSAGMGTRMVPLSYTLPKPLLSLKSGETLIERLIVQLHEANVEDITIVVGYLHQEFDYLKTNGKIKLVYNDQYQTKDSYASFQLVSHHVSNCFIVAGDLYFEENIFLNANTHTWMGAVKTNTRTDLEIIECAYFAQEDITVLTEHMNSVDQNSTRTLKAFLSSLPFTLNPIAKKNTINFNSIHDVARHRNIVEVKPDECIAVIKAFFNCSVEDIHDLQQLGLGMTNTSFLFTIEGTRYVFRLPGVGTDQLINRAQEASVYHKIKHLGIADNVVFIDSNNGYKISEYLPNARQLEPSEIKKAMLLLKEFHRKQIQEQHSFNLRERIAFYHRICEQESVHYFEEFASVLASMEVLLSWIDSLKRQHVLCHIDSVFDNFIVAKNNKIYLLDWEYSGMQDPLLDVAMFAIYSNYDEKQALKLLRDYLEKTPSKQEVMLLYALMALSGFLWSLWTLFKEARGSDFGNYGQQQFNYGLVFGTKVLNYLGNDYEK